MKVSELLGFSSMRQAKVIAGASLLEKLVTTVTVLEVSDPAQYQGITSTEEYAGSELLLTSFANK